MLLYPQANMFNMLKIYKSYKAAYLYGSGVMTFFKKDYEDAVRIFERVLVLEKESDSGKLECTYSYLGRSYLALGQLDKAMASLSHAYNIYVENDFSQISTSERQEMIAALKAFSNVLEMTGQTQFLRKVVREIETEEKKNQLAHQ